MRIVITPATSAGCGGDEGQVRSRPATEELAVGVLGETQDQRVQHDDVGHREERDQAAADLTSYSRVALADLEELVHVQILAERCITLVAPAHIPTQARHRCRLDSTCGGARVPRAAAR